MGKEDFIKAGYVYFGYISPALSSESTYPDYIKENVSRAIEKIKSKQKDGAVSFAFMADLHYSATENHDIRTKRLMNAYGELKEKANIQKLILGGDYVNDGTKEYKLNNYRCLRAFLENEKYFPVNGNHDDNSIWDLCIESRTSTHHLTQAELYEEFFSHLPSLGAEFDKNKQGLYYFYDDEALKVRYIFIDSNDIPYSADENGKLNYTKQHLFALSQAQLDWLTKEALCFGEDGWDIIIVSHAFPRWDEEAKKREKELERLEVLGDIIDSYQSGEDLKKSYFEDEFKVSVCAEFSKRRRGNIIAGFAGHYHADFEEYSKSGVPIVYTGNVIMYQYSVPRTDGDKSELLFDVVTIDRSSKTIYTTRIGAGEDRAISYASASLNNAE